MDAEGPGERGRRRQDKSDDELMSPSPLLFGTENQGLGIVLELEGLGEEGKGSERTRRMGSV